MKLSKEPSDITNDLLVDLWLFLTAFVTNAQAPYQAVNGKCGLKYAQNLP
jgi:hypothetical protein